MSGNYDNWERLVGAVLRREKDRRLAYCESFSSSSSADLSSRFSFVGDVHESADLCSGNIFFSRDVKAMEYEEIRKATSNFRADNLLGGGQYSRSRVYNLLGEEGQYSRSRVYKGWIDENYLATVKPGSGIAVAVAVENLHEGLDSSSLEEIINLSEYRHPNLVTPIAYSCDTETRVFVNEFMAGGSLDRHLFIAQKPLPWATRMRVGVGAARGLAFLHSLEIPVIYVVLKSGDILLDADFNAKLSDFGIIKDVFTHEIEGPWGVITLQIESKYGPYAAPEFVDAGRRSTKGDVYSFGVVLLELISGHQEGKKPKEWQNLIMDLGKKRRLSRIMDSRLEGEYPPKEAYKVAKIALQCVSFDPILRPTMADVVAELESL